MSAAKVLGWGAILDRRLGQTELLDEEGAAVGASDAVESVEADGELAGLEERLDEAKVKDLGQVRDVVLDGVDDLDLEVSKRRLADLGQVNVVALDDLVPVRGVRGEVSDLGFCSRYARSLTR